MPEELGTYIGAQVNLPAGGEMVSGIGRWGI